MRSFINAIFSFILSAIESYLSKNMYTQQVFARTVEEQLEGDDRVNPSYSHHKRTPSALSAEFGARNRPEGNVLDWDQFIITPTSEPSSPISFSEISKDTPTYLEVDKIDASPRLNPISRCVTPYDVPNLTLDITTMITATGTDDLDISSTSSESPSTPDLPSDSFSPLLRANRLALDADTSWKASRFGMATATPTTAGKESRPLFGLGIFDISRKEDHSHAFDGLGIVRVQSSPWRGKKSKTSPVKHGDDSLDEGEQDNNTQLEYSHPISETFLHDLEAFFLVRDFTPSPSKPLSFSSHCSGDEHNGGPTFDIIVEEPTTESREENSPSMVTTTTFTPVPAAGNRGCCLPSHTSTPANMNINLARRIRNALSLTPRRAVRPLSNLCTIGSCISSSQATSCSLATPTHTSMSIPSSSSSSISFGIPTSSSGSRSAFVRRTCSALTLPRHDTRSLPSTRHYHGADTVSPRHLTVSVPSMGPSPSPTSLDEGFVGRWNNFERF